MPISENAIVQTAFDQAATTYDSSCFLQRQTCIKLIGHLIKIRANFPNIVDLGCGTGLSTQLLSDHFEHKHLVGVDFSKKLLEQAKNNLKPGNVELCQGDFNKLLFRGAVVDLAFSNMAFQWSQDISKTLSIIGKQLKDNALLAFSMPISGTFSEISVNHRNSFFDFADIVNGLAIARYTQIMITSEKLVYNFPTQLEALKSIKLVGANALLKPHKNIGLTTLRGILNQDAACPSLTYKIAYVIAQKDT